MAPLALEVLDARIGRLLKSWQIAYARRHGFTRIVTNHRAGNRRIIEFWLTARSDGWNKTAKDRLIYAPSEKPQACKLAAARHPTVVRSWTLTFSAQGGLLVNTCFESFKTSQRNAAVDASAYRFMGETLIE